MPSSVPRPGWWQATDGQWYPPELHPDVRARVAATLGRPVAAAAPSVPAPVPVPDARPAAGASGGESPRPASAGESPRPASAGESPRPASGAETAGETSAGAAGAPPGGGRGSTRGSLPRPDGSDRAVPPVHRLAVPPDDRAGDDMARGASPSDSPTSAAARPGGDDHADAPSRAKRWATTAAVAVLVLGGIVLVTRGADRRSNTAADSSGAGVARAASTTRAGTNDAITVVTAPAPTTANPTPPTPAPTTPTPTPTPTTPAPSTGAAVPTSSATVAPATSAASSTTPSTLPAVRDVAVFQLTTGSCIDQADLTERPVTTVRVVPCGLSHTHEVYATTAYSGSNTYDADRLARFADGYCTDEFARYVGIDYARSKYFFVQIVPTQDSWTRNADRDIVCAAFLEGGRLTGSVKGRAE
jgi:hypothetical protein